VQQQATAHPIHSPLDVGDGDLRTLIECLIDAQLDGARLAKRVMLLQDLADSAQSLACAAYDEARGAVGDSDAVDRAILSGSAASRANEDELDATIAWKEHLQHTDDLVETARRILQAL
jgi:methyl coenzyme M reductase gamma subunit